MEGRIQLFVSHDRVHVWNSDDVLKLRHKYRIVGGLVGCLARAPHQNSQLGLPLQLLPCEAALLLEKRYAQIGTCNVGQPCSSTKKQLYQEKSEQLYQQQVHIYKEGRKKMILSKADEIVQGKKRRITRRLKKSSRKEPNDDPCDEQTGDDVQLPELDRDTVIQEEIDKIAPIPREKSLIQLHTQCPWPTTDQENTLLDWQFPCTEREKLRYRIFKDLWEKGYYLTCGLKFGGDFLAYAGDPLRHHSIFVIVCKEHSKQIPPSDLVLLSRLGTQVKKTILLATVKPDNTISYTSLWWQGHLEEKMDTVPNL